MALWYVSGDTGYYHLGACSEVGYELRALFGLFWYAIEYFTESVFGCLVSEAAPD